MTGGPARTERVVITSFNPFPLISSSQAAFENQPRPPCFSWLRPFGEGGRGLGGSARVLQCRERPPCVQTKAYPAVKTHVSPAHGG